MDVELAGYGASHGLARLRCQKAIRDNDPGYAVRPKNLRYPQNERIIEVDSSCKIKGFSYPLRHRGAEYLGSDVRRVCDYEVIRLFTGWCKEAFSTCRRAVFQHEIKETSLLKVDQHSGETLSYVLRGNLQGTFIRLKPKSCYLEVSTDACQFSDETEPKLSMTHCRVQDPKGACCGYQRFSDLAHLASHEVGKNGRGICCPISFLAADCSIPASYGHPC